MEGDTRIVGRKGVPHGVGAEQVLKFLRRPELAVGKVDAADTGAGRHQGQVELLGVGGRSITRFSQRRDVLAQPIEFVQTGFQPPPASVDHPRMPPGAFGGEIPQLRLSGTLFPGQAIPNGGVNVSIVRVLDELQVGKGHRRGGAGVAQGYFALEVIRLGVGVIPPKADGGVLFQAFTRRQVGPHPFQYGPLAADIGQDGEKSLAQGLKVQTHPARSIRALELERLDAVGVGDAAGGGTQAVAQHFAHQTRGMRADQFGEGRIGARDAQVRPQPCHGHGNRVERRPIRLRE